MLYSERFTVAPGTRRLRLKITSVGPVNVTDSRFSADQTTTLAGNIAAALRASLRYRIEYGIGWQSAANAATAVALGNLRQSPVNEKVYRFEWNAIVGDVAARHVPNYQLQLLRLYNQQDLSDAALQSRNLPTEQQQALRNGTAVLTTLDWSKALTLETESSNPEAILTLAEGTGFYAWRVRPIGTLHAGGIANARNYGAWSTADAAGRQFFIDGRNPVPDVQAFFYKDPDDAINHLYSRTFTEGNRVSEKITYASPLQQVKQTQAYLPSQGTTAVSQTVYDHNNRPAVNTLPVPVEGQTGLNGYREGFVRPATGGERPYNADHLDRKNATTPVEQQTSDFRYYGGVRDNVPNAEGYPFTRNRYYNDGTNRVAEQSGVGQTHMIGGGGKTVKNLFGTASDDELIRLFGDEAPASESVLKTVTIDQNNTETITYTSKEGKVIATCLAYRDQQADGLLPVSENAADANQIQITDKITANVRQGDVLVASKRLVLLGDITPLTIEYVPTPCANPADLGCTTLKLNCLFDLRMYLKRVDGESFDPELKKTVTGWEFLKNPDGTPNHTVL
ncbi:MAG TPA: hypothetical protein VF646_01185, partial [Cytophagales bacterium]